MTVLPIVTDLAALRVKSQPVTVFDDDLRRLAADMVETMHANNGIGLAAVQVGVPMRVIVVQTETRGPLVMINPRITYKTKHVLLMTIEGCLSLPGVKVEVSRPVSVDVAYENVYGTACSHELRQIDAVIFQHELDHLNGVLITDYAMEGAR